MPPRPPSGAKSPSRRRMTLGGVPASQVNRRISIDNNASALPATGVKPKRPPTGRKSMLPRMERGGRENLPPATPGRSVPSTPRGGGTVPSSPRVPASPRVPSTPGVLAPTAASHRRSLGGASMSRRNSILPVVAKPADDPRPLQDKAFQQRAIKSLLTFLKEADYPHAVTQRSLSKPSSKEVHQILTFLLRITDANFQVESEMKFEDEVCLQFKCLGYPFTISKTSLAAAGSPHTWPTLLAALSWLAEHLTRMRHDNTPDYLGSVQPFQTLEDLDNHTVKAFYQYLLLCHQAFMHGEVNRINELELALQKRFDDDDKLLESELERTDDLNAAIIEQMNLLKEGHGQLSEWQKKRDGYLDDLGQFQDLSKKMDDHKRSLQQKKEDITKELRETNEGLDSVKIRVENLKEMIQSQKLSAGDAVKLETERKSAVEAMQRLSQVKKKLEKELLDLEKTFSEHSLACEAVMDRLNGKLGDVRSFSAFAKAFQHVRFSLNNDKILEDPVAAFGVDCKNTLEPAINETVVELESKTNDVKEERQATLDRFGKTESQLKEALSVNQIVLDKIAMCEKNLQLEQQAHESKLAVREREVNTLERKVEARSDPVALEEQRSIMERELAELEALREKYEAENVQRKKLVMDEIESACELMMEQESFLQAKRQEVEEYRAAKMAKAAAVTTSVDLV